MRAILHEDFDDRYCEVPFANFPSDPVECRVGESAIRLERCEILGFTERRCRPQ